VSTPNREILMAKAVPQTPKERLIPGNVRVIGPNGKTTWKFKGV